jgi:hypothetical protein
MQQGLPDEDTELSKKGSLLHWYDAHPELDRAFLKPSDRDLLETSKTLDDLVIQRVTDQFALQDKTFTEQREVAGKYSQDGFEITGHPDRIRFYEDLTVIFEKKFGFLDQTPAELNKQLRVYSLIFAKDESVVSMLQPRKSFDERVTIAHYTKADIESSRQEVLSILEAASKPDAPLNATEDGCRYCRAKLICSAFKATMLVPAVLTPDKALSKTAREAYLAQRLAELTDEQLEKTIVAERLAKMIHDPLYDEARKRIKAGAMKNHKLGKASEVSEIVDAQRAISLLEIAGILTKEESLAMCSMPIGSVKEKYREAHPGMTWDKARDKINRVLSSVIETHVQREKVLRR